MGLFRKKQIPIPDLYKKNRISANKITDKCAQGFLKAAYGFYLSNNLIQQEIAWHNEANEKYQNMVQDIVKGKTEFSHLDELNLYSHKNKKNSLIVDIRNRNTLDITCGYLELECLYECNLIRKDKSFSKSEFLKKCISEKIVAACRTENGNFVSPSAAEIEKYYDICNEYLRLMHVQDSKLCESVEDMFNEKGIIFLLNENGERVPAEDDPMKNYIEIDYKGVI